MSYDTLQTAVEDLRQSNEALVDTVLASDTSVRENRDAARQSEQAATASAQEAKTSEEEALEMKADAEKYATLSYVHTTKVEELKNEVTALLTEVASEADRAEEAARNAAETGLGDQGEYLASLASVYDKPLVDLDFVRKSYTQQGKYPWLEDGIEFKFERTTPRWAFGPDGQMREYGVDEPTYKYDPITGECQGILMEPYTWNHIKNSTNFGGSTNAGGSISRGSTTLPGIPFPASLIGMGTSSSSGIYLSEISEVQKGDICTFSVYCQLRDHSGGEHDGKVVSIGIEGSGFLSRRTYFLLDGDGEILEEWSNSYSRIERVGLDVYRLSLTAEAQSSGTSTIVIYSGDGTRDSASFAVALPQFEDSPYPTSPVPTYGSKVSRSSESAWLDLDDGFIPQAFGVYVAFTPTPRSSYKYERALTIGQDSMTYIQYQLTSGKGTQVYSRLDGDVVVANTIGAEGLEGELEGMFSADGTYFKAVAGTGERYADIRAPHIRKTRLYVGNYFGGVNTLGGTVGRIAIYPRMFSVTEMEARTS